MQFLISHPIIPKNVILLAMSFKSIDNFKQMPRKILILVC